MTLPSEVKAALRDVLYKTGHFDASTQEKFDEVEKVTDEILATLQPEIERLVASELKNLINDDTIVYWNDDRDDDGHIFISDLRERVKALTKSNQKDHLK